PDRTPLSAHKGARPIVIVVTASQQSQRSRRSTVARKRDVSKKTGRRPGKAHDMIPKGWGPCPGRRSLRKTKNPDRHGFWGRFVKSLQNTAFRRFSVAFHG